MGNKKKKKRKKEKPTLLDTTLARVLAILTIIDLLLELIDKLKK